MCLEDRLQVRSVCEEDLGGVNNNVQVEAGSA